MQNKFAQNVIKELNNFRSNPKSIQHQCELIRTGFSRLRANDPFLKEIESFLKELETLKPVPELKYNEALSEAAKKELPKFRGRSDYQKYRTGKSLKGIVPDHYLEAFPALVADDGADEPVNVLTKTLLNKLDKFKEGRAILCDRKYTQVGIAHEVFDEENMVILIFASKYVDSKPIESTKKDFLFNIQYHETKAIKKPRLQSYVYHRIRGDIFGGGENFVKTNEQKAIYSQGPNRPKLKMNENTETLRGNKSQKVVTKYSSRTTAPVKAKPPATKTSTAKNEKIIETTMKRRNEGTTTKTETRTETKTTTTGTRGRPNETFNSTTTKVITRGGRRTGSDKNTTNEIPKKSEQNYKTKTESIVKRGRGGNETETKKEIIRVTKIEEKDIKEDNKTAPSGNRFRRGKYGNQTENKIITITKVENDKDEIQTKNKKEDNKISNKTETETKIVSITVTKVEESGNDNKNDNDKGEMTITKTTKRFSKEEKDNVSEPKEETKIETKVEVKEENSGSTGGASIRRKYGKKKRF